MPLYKPSELRSFLTSIGAGAKKSLSQNFLIDGNILDKIVAAADVKEGDLILEIGPGPGALTEALLEAKADVIAVEKDRAFAAALGRLQSESSHLQVFQEDILDFSFEEHLAKKKTKLIANLPYHLTTPILQRVIPLHNIFSTIVIMVQDEVAKRMCALPGSEDYSSISVFLNIYATVKYGFKVGRNCFYPSPKVDSAIVILQLKNPPNIDLDAFFKLTRSAFQQRRKMLKVSLKPLYDPEAVMQALKKMGLDPLSRPETLSCDQFLTLFNSCYAQN